jgi:hypothetical protein
VSDRVGAPFTAAADIARKLYKKVYVMNGRRPTDVSYLSKLSNVAIVLLGNNSIELITSSLAKIAKRGIRKSTPEVLACLNHAQGRERDVKLHILCVSGVHNVCCLMQSGRTVAVIRWIACTLQLITVPWEYGILPQKVSIAKYERSYK